MCVCVFTSSTPYAAPQYFYHLFSCLFVNIEKADGSNDFHSNEEWYSLTMSVKWHKVECFACAIRYFVSVVCCLPLALVPKQRQHGRILQPLKGSARREYKRFPRFAPSAGYELILKQNTQKGLHTCLSVNEARLFRIIMFLLFVCFLHFWVYTNNPNTQVAQTFTALLKEQ